MRANAICSIACLSRSVLYSENRYIYIITISTICTYELSNFVALCSFLCSEPLIWVSFSSEFTMAQTLQQSLLLFFCSASLAISHGTACVPIDRFVIAVKMPNDFFVLFVALLVADDIIFSPNAIRQNRQLFWFALTSRNASLKYISHFSLAFSISPRNNRL